MQKSTQELGTILAMRGKPRAKKKYEKVKLGIVPSKNLDSFLGVERDLRVARVSSLTTRQQMRPVL